MLCSRCNTKNPENSAYCYNCGEKIFTTEPGQPPPNDPAVVARQSAIARVLVARERGLATEADVEKVIQEVRQDAARDKEIREALDSKLIHLDFFTAVDGNGVMRFFDIMEQEDIFSLAESATTAPRLGPCTETVYELPGRGEFHHVHRIYGACPKASTANTSLAMHKLATFYSLTQVMEIAETHNQLQANPIKVFILQKLGCPIQDCSPKSTTEFTK